MGEERTKRACTEAMSHSFEVRVCKGWWRVLGTRWKLRMLPFFCQRVQTGALLRQSSTSVSVALEW